MSESADYGPRRSDRQMLAELRVAYQRAETDTVNGWPTVRDIAEHSDLGSSQVRRRLLELADAGRCRTAMTVSLADHATRARSFAPAEEVLGDD